MPLPDPMPITPIAGPIDVLVSLPGSKSITNRALVCAALADGTSTLVNALHADDTEAMVDGLRAMGAEIDAHWAEGRLVVSGTAGHPVSDVAIIDARLSGTTSRFLLPLAGLGEGHRRVDAANRMRERPMEEVIDAVRALGAEVHEVGAPGHLPVEVIGGTLAGGEVAVRGDVSSQFLSGLLLAGPAMRTGLVARLVGGLVSEPYVDMTVAVMGSFGVEVRRPDPSDLAGGAADLSSRRRRDRTRCQRGVVRVRGGGHPGRTGHGHRLGGGVPPGRPGVRGRARRDGRDGRSHGDEHHA